MPLSAFARALRRKKAATARRRDHVARSAHLQELEDRTLLTVLIEGNVSEQLGSNLGALEDIEVRLVDAETGDVIMANDAGGGVFDGTDTDDPISVETDAEGNYSIFLEDTVAEGTYKIQFVTAEDRETADLGPTEAVGLDDADNASFADVFSFFFGSDFQTENTDNDASPSDGSTTVFETEEFTLELLEEDTVLGLARDGDNTVVDDVDTSMIDDGVYFANIQSAFDGNEVDDQLLFDAIFAEQTGTIMVNVFDDANENGLREPDDAPSGPDEGRAGVTVHLRDTDTDEIIDTQVTDGDGNVTFEAPAGDYVVQVVPPEGTTFTTQDAFGPSGDDFDSDVDATGRADVTVEVDTEASLAAGLVADSGTIRGRVFDDVDGDALFVDGIDSPRAGVIVQLTQGEGEETTLIETTATNANGRYRFDDVPSGTYTVTVMAPTGYAFTEEDAFENTADDIDSDVDADGTVAVSLSAEEVEEVRDAGLIEVQPLTGEIRGTVFDDTNNDGLAGGAEPGRANVVVVLKQDESTVAVTVTDEDGEYVFPDLDPGTYTVEIVKPNTTYFTIQDVFGNAADAVDSDVDQSLGTVEVSVAADDVEVRDAGLVAIPEDVLALNLTESPADEDQFEEGEKWFRLPSGQFNQFGSKWYFLLPNGDLYAWNNASRSTSSGELFASLGAQFYEDTSWAV